ncbi:MAG: HPF/RaiA family ribosome-associated protein [Candidatus Binatia bacterium]
MKLEIVGQRIEVTEAVSTHIERRLRFTLGRFGARIVRVTVTLADLSELRGGINKQCRMIAAIVPQGEAVVEANDVEILSAIDRAAERLGRVLTYELERRRGQTIRKPEAARISASVLFRRQSRARHEEGGLQ